MIPPLIFMMRIFLKLCSLVFLSVDQIQKETIRITKSQTASLKNFFLFKNALLMSREQKKQFADECIVKFPEFSQLNQSQILRCLSAYNAEILIRQNHGEYFSKGTEKMMKDDNDFAFQAVIFSLSFMKQMAATNEVNGIPTDLSNFIDRWVNYSVKEAAGQSVIGILEEDDMDDINTLVKFVKDLLLPYYLSFWKKFSKVEIDGNVAEMKGRPDLHLAKIEELVILDRLSIYELISQLARMFYEGTCMKYFVFDVNGKDLYSFKSSRRKEANNPPYVELAISGNKDPLMRLLLSTFEMGFYDFYNRHLILQSC